MKKTRIYQFTLGIVLTLFFTMESSAQSIIQDDASRQVEMAAKERAEKWNDELALRAKQMILLEKKFIEFDLKRLKVMDANISPEEKVERLKNLKILETKDIRDILTQPQYDRYLLLLEKEAEEPNAGQ
ncbi:hypothetical protein [Salinimicrobium sp. HB62]|uniref:hypothetical protein n=1 Tax=Salinimicrobium sp. HB62 TaxID=3077781 RepID=UPI002D7A01AC|nr:hypothetical protein [Salinimicrobium sp. HB62]